MKKRLLCYLIVIMLVLSCVILTSCGCPHENTVWQGECVVLCTVDGYTGDTYCLDCERIIEKGKVITATGHQKSELRNVIESSCVVMGYSGDILCANCGELLEAGETLPALEHTLIPEGNGTTPTCSSTGYSGDATCSVCKTFVEGSVLPPLAHDYKKNVCIKCGWMTPGLYQNDVLVMTWEDLKAGGYATVEDGQLKTMTGDYGLGKLVVGEDVTYLDGNYSYGINKINASEVWLPASITNLGSFIANNGYIEKLVIFGTITDIPAQCFDYVLVDDSLETLVLPDTVRTIGDYAMKDRTKLTEFEFPASVESIGREAFYNCGLTEVELPEGLKTIGLYAFGASKLKSITLPSSIETLRPEAFKFCDELETVDMSACVNITTLESGLFRYCTKLTKLILPPNLTDFRSGHDLFGSGTDDQLILETLDLPEGFVSFGGEKFDRVALKSIVWPVSLLDGSALANCPLETIYYTGTEAQWNMVKGHDVFTNATVIFEYQRS